MDEDAPAASRDVAIRLLARREHSTYELKLKLIQRGFDVDEIDSVLESLAAENLLSDSRFASEYSLSRRARGFGPVRISAELRERGVDPSLVEEALVPFAGDWVGEARLQRRKRFGAKPPGDWKHRARQIRFLTNRGFTVEQSRRAVDDIEP